MTNCNVLHRRVFVMFDDPDSTSTGMSGVQVFSGFDPLYRKTRRNKTISLTKMSDTLSSVAQSIYE